MSEHGENFPQRYSIDPIQIVGVMLLTLFVLMFVGNAIDSALSDDTGGDEAAIIASSEQDIAQVLPTAAPTSAPTPLAASGRITATVTAAPSATPTARPTATETNQPTATASPTATSTPSPTPVQLTEEREPIARVEGPMTDDGIDRSSTPAPTATPLLPTPIPGGDYEARVPILMYHYVSSPPADADKYRTDLSVLPSELLKQMTYLRDNGYTTITLNELALAISNQADLPPKPIILTFDDGHLDNYHNAFPILRGLGMVGTFFIITDLPDIQHPDYMSWPMIEEMAAAGMQIEIHTKSHRSLEERDEDFLVEEIAGSQEIIAYHTGSLPRFLAYPGGAYDDTTIQVARDLDLWGALTTRHGYTHGYFERFEMRRVRIRNTTTVDFFAEWIEGRELDE